MVYGGPYGGMAPQYVPYWEPVDASQGGKSSGPGVVRSSLVFSLCFLQLPGVSREVFVFYLSWLVPR